MQKSLPIFCFVLLTYYSGAQCVFPDGITVPDIACGTGTPLANNANINTNSVYYFNGTNGNFSNISLSGGTLVLCGSANLTNVNHNGGTILINPGAVITFSGNYNIGGSPHLFFNLGSVTFPNNVQLQGTDQFVYNGPGANLTVPGEITFLNSGTLFNYGTTTTNKVVINGSDIDLCFGPGAINITQSIESNGSGNSIIVPEGSACISYTGTLTGNAPLTSTANFKICQASGASAPAPVAVGGATVISDCQSCNMVLPAKLASFNGGGNAENFALEWRSEIEQRLSMYVIEKSYDGSQFEWFAQVPAHNAPSSYKYTFFNSGKAYFRLKIVDMDGRFTYSSVIVWQEPIIPIWRLLANPVNGPSLDVSIEVSQSQAGELIVMDNLAKILRKKSFRLLRGIHIISIDVSNLPKGTYYLRFVADKHTYSDRVISFINNN